MNLHILDTTNVFSIYILDDYSYSCYYFIQKDEMNMFVPSVMLVWWKQKGKKVCVWGGGGGDSQQSLALFIISIKLQIIPQTWKRLNAEEENTVEVN